MIVTCWLERAALATPNRTAIETPQGARTYAELLADAHGGAAELARQGVAPGERVAIALPPGLAFAQALHACLLLGAVAVPVDLRLSPAERAHVTAGAAMVLQEPLRLRGDTGRGDAGRRGATRGGAGRCGAGRGGATRGDAGRRDAVRGDAGKDMGEGSPVGHELTDTAVVIFTSGTTSAPKPVELTYGNFLWSALGSAVALGLDRQRERWLCALPLAHVGGLSILLRSAIYGTTAVVHERFDAELVLHALREQRITLVSLVATTLARLLDAGLGEGAAGRHGCARADAATLRCALTGGGPVPVALLERAAAAGVPVSQTYGLTEACSQATTTPLAAIGRGRHAADAGWAGTPIFCTRIRIQTDGEILLSGPTIAPASRDAEGWLHTGDLGTLDEHSRLHVSGRASETIISGGENVSPSEVEAVLEAFPGVLEAAAIGRPDPRWGEAVTAIVVPRPGVVLEEEPLRAHCAATLAPYKVPKQIVLSQTQLPRTRSGKLLRRELT